jgi:hypothetical protein
MVESRGRKGRVMVKWGGWEEGKERESDGEVGGWEEGREREAGGDLAAETVDGGLVDLVAAHDHHRRELRECKPGVTDTAGIGGGNRKLYLRKNRGEGGHGREGGHKGQVGESKGLTPRRRTQKSVDTPARDRQDHPSRVARLASAEREREREGEMMGKGQTRR